ncbi:hypothetical protein Ssi03_66250 [Sphaerisporangium siamense]|uniref:Uma2 family endonuclease n=1 Tax=Sphaerisporangium siamense TaxID=795645 RepID=A0A7W7DHB1_9ACTN|nr:Uma2 family endonuclease [Sphaerisporangium siamense]MBB4706010.1 Uma2 family endonuclease [Sphaerisporangium siamense]GII88635.1 hypothetical protein Ssi03_66250 [Sphaerisporangium siamense]
MTEHPLDVGTESLWPVPPSGGHTVEDLVHLPDLPSHTQLIDGSLIFAAPQTAWHSVVLDLLGRVLRECCPAEYRVRRQTYVMLGPRQCPEPDIMIISSNAAHADTGVCRPADVLLTVEAMTPDSELRDRERKPQLYAEAGIPHFWRVERSSGPATVYVYELDPATRSYALMGIHHDKLHLSIPFEIDVDLAEVERL